ncbi:MAG: hypothetical protein NC905_00850 [Candidatus Omnitrophica bacterium]|nr:hypothetical protein [Candidatus Omnitrophota bacterium]
MEWKKTRGGFTGGSVVEVRSVKIADHNGQIRRFRISTLREPSAKFTKIPAEAQLFKSEKGYIGVLITGKYGGYVKVGKDLTVQQCISVSLNCLSKKPLKKLLKGTSIEITEIDGTIVGIER